jgi:hypothetical protein
MNQTNTALEFSNATRRILRWRIPLFFALIANIAFLARLAFVPTGAVAAQPEPASASIANRSPALQPSDSDPVNPLGRSSTSATTATSDIATHALSVPEVDLNAMQMAGPSVSPLVATSTLVAGASEPAAKTNLPTAPSHATTSEVLDYLPDVSDLATRWWPVIESVAEAAARHAATQQPLTQQPLTQQPLTQQPLTQQPPLGHLSIGNGQQNGVPVSFVLDGRVYTLHPGESHQFPVGTSWSIQFHRGGAFGNASEAVTPGEYQFVVGPDGWALRPAH